MSRCRVTRFILPPLMILTLCLAACSDGPDSHPLAPDANFVGRQNTLLTELREWHKRECLRPLGELFYQRHGSFYADDRSMGTVPLLIHIAQDEYASALNEFLVSNGRYVQWSQTVVLAEAPVEFYRAYIRFLKEVGLPGARSFRAFLDVLEEQLGPEAKPFADNGRKHWDAYIAHTEKGFLPALETYLSRAEEASAKNPARREPARGILKADLDRLLGPNPWEGAGTDLPAFDRAYFEMLAEIPGPALEKITAVLEKHMASEPDKAGQYALQLAIFTFWAERWQQQVALRLIAWDLFEALRDKAGPGRDDYSLGACMVLFHQVFGNAASLPLFGQAIFPDFRQGQAIYPPGTIPYDLTPSLPAELMPLMRELYFLSARDYEKSDIFFELEKLQPELEKVREAYPPS